MIAKDITTHALLKTMTAAGLRLIPLRAGQRYPFTAGWTKNGAKNVGQFAGLLARTLGRPTTAGAEFVRTWRNQAATDADFNVGVNNELSRTMVLDLDHPKAIEAVIAGICALDSEHDHASAMLLLDSAARWQSVRGVKRIWKLRPASKQQKTVFLTGGDLIERPAGSGKMKPQTIFELRGAGQDALPPSKRDDAGGFQLEWIDGPPDSIPFLPAVLSKLHTALDTKQADVIEAMHDAINTPADVRMIAQTNTDSYPSRLRHEIPQAVFINKTFDVEQMLTANGYRPAGGGSKRWRGPDTDPGSTAGLAPPQTGKQALWQCFDSDDPLVGQFDAWRIFVDLSCGHDIDDAIAQTDDAIAMQAAAPGEAKMHLINGQPYKPTGLDEKALPTKHGPVKVSKPTKPARETTRGQSGIPVDDDDYEQPIDLTKDYSADVITNGVMKIQKGLTGLVGKPKSGKSHLAVGLAMTAMKPGFRYLDTTSNREACNVMIYGPDATRESYWHAMQVIDPAYKPDGRLFIHDERHTVDKLYGQVGAEHDGDLLSALVAFCKDKNVGVLILDTLAAVSRHIETDATKEQDKQYDVNSTIRSVADENDLAIIGLIHAKKGSVNSFDHGNASESIAGMNSAVGGLTATLTVMRLSDESFGAPLQDGLKPKVTFGYYMEGRQGNNWQAVMEFDPNTNTAKHKRGMQPKDYGALDLKTLLVQTMMMLKPDDFTGLEVLVSLVSGRANKTVSPRRVRDALAGMKVAGAVETAAPKAGGGYRLTDAGRKATPKADATKGSDSRKF